MAYQTGTATDQTDLMSKLNTFAAANGFTTENYNGTTRFLSLSRSADDLYVTFYWDASDHIALYQALGYSGTYAEQPWNQVDDSGNGNNVLGSIESGRNVNNIGNGPFTAYHFFGYTNPYAIHVVLEYSPGLYRHFGFGMLNKTGTWTGGAWCGGHHWNPQNSFGVYDVPGSVVHSILLDGAHVPTFTTYTYSRRAGGTIHVEGLPNQPAASKWGVGLRPTTDDIYIDTDRGGNDRVRIAGGMREGVHVTQYGWLLPDLSNGFLPIIPISTFYVDGDIDAGSDGWYYLGNMPDIGMVQLEGIDPAQELTVGAETWIAFPAVRKAKVGGNNEESWNMGIIYNKVV